MARVRLNSEAIHDGASFHAECARALGFPGYYGHNLDAWLDCMSCLREPGAGGMAAISLAQDEVLLLEIPDAEALEARAPHVVADLVTVTAAANARYVADGGPPALALVPC
jgi:hypothetical protein